MKQWLKVHSRAYSKVNLLYGLLLGLNLLSLIICTIYYCINKYSFENFIEDDPDIDLTGLKSFSFTGKYDLYYKADLSNLGTTGKLYFDCYTGKCKYEKTYSCTKETCTINEDEKVECTSYESTCTDSYSQNEFSCSNVCRNSKKVIVVINIVIQPNLLIISMVVLAHMMVNLKALMIQKVVMQKI